MMLLAAQEMHGRFNINNLVINGVVDNKQVEIFQRLLENLELDPNLVWPLVDWLDTNDELIGPLGAENDSYSQLTPPYRPANQPMINPDELAAVQGYTPPVLAALVGHVVALPVLRAGTPTATLINVNFITEPLLLSLSVKMASAAVEAVLQEATDDGFNSVNDFLNAINDANPYVNGLSSSIDRTLLSVQSEYFLLEYQGGFEPVVLKSHSIMHRDSDAKVRIINRAQGEYYSVTTAIY